MSNQKTNTFNALIAESFRFSQSENAKLKYIGNWKAELQGVSISTSIWSVTSGDATITTESLDGNTASCFISGQPGENIIINKITTDDGQTDERRLLIEIRNNETV